MYCQSSNLTEIYNPALPAYSVYFLTGEKYWYQTAFCLYSLQKVCNHMQINGIFIDDGSIAPTLKAQIVKQFPNSRIISADETEALLDIYLPWSKYPVIRAKRLIYPHIKKLTDIHTGSSNWKLVLDSDMLFFKKPNELLIWLKQPLKPLLLHDPICSYHYSLNLMKQITGFKIVPNLNVGAIGLKSENIDWDKLENWIALLEKNEGTSYLLEQALSAMLIAGEEITVADSTNYIVLPDKEEAQNPTAVLHHYVAGAKEWYYKISWRKIA